MNKKVIQEDILEVKFNKDQILKAKNYKSKSDILSTILEDNKLYSLDEVDSLIEKFMKGKVN